jgi:aminoglycoside phosphotransferase (APT) family kinase protein
MVRISGDGYLRMMRNAVAQRVAMAPTPQDGLLLNGLNEMVARSERGAGAVIAIRDDLQVLIDRITAISPELLTGRDGAIAKLTRSELAGEDPADYFVRALALLQAIVDAMGDPGLLPPERLALAGDIARWEEKIIRGERDGQAEPKAEVETGGLSAETVHAFLVDRLPEVPDLQILSFEEILGGMSKRTFSMTIRSSARGTEEMIVKKADGPPLAPLDCMTIPREYRVLQAARAAGISVPEPLWLGRDIPAANGDFYIMRRSRGGASTSLLSTSSPIPETVLLGIAEQMARLHCTPLENISAFVADTDPDMPDLTVDQAVARRLEAWRQIWLGFDRLPSPLESYLFSWLKANIPENAARPSLVHGDLTPHNCLWDGDELTAVLDWECAHFGDPAEDLSYAKPLIEQRMDWGKFLAHYHACGGPQTSERAMTYHSCYLNLRSVLLANMLVVAPPGRDLRPLIVDTQFAGLFADTCMSAIRKFEALPPA